MSHLKRQAIPKKWPIPRKGTKYLVKSASHERQGIPLLIVIRDILKIAKTRKEVKKALHAKSILVNGRVSKDDKHGLTLFDKISIIPAKKNYEVILT